MQKQKGATNTQKTKPQAQPWSSTHKQTTQKKNPKKLSQLEAADADADIGEPPKHPHDWLYHLR